MSVLVRSDVPRRLRRGLSMSLAILDFPVFGVLVYPTVCSLTILGVTASWKSDKSRVMTWW